MSNWTHVAGIVRVDCFRLMGGIDFTEVFGKELKFSDDQEVWVEADAHPEQFLPMGSEGSLKMTVYENPDRCHLDAYTVSVFGDLRDHDDPKAIVEWFKEKCSKLNVRNACITAENEWGGVENWVYREEEA